MSQVNDILKMIERLSDAEQEELESRLAERFEARWRIEAGRARSEATKRGIDQQTIDRAVEEHRYGR